MLPLIAVGIAVLGAGTAAYKYFSSNEKTEVGSIALWGVPNSGKSTFIRCLMGESPSEDKVQTNYINKHENLNFSLDGVIYNIELIQDMPGVETRKDEWLGQVKKSKNSIYMINLEKFFDERSGYLNDVRQHLKELKEALPKDESKNLIIVGTHLDKTRFSSSDQPNNLIQQSDQFGRIREIFHSFWFYSVNLLDDKSFRRLMESIVGDVGAKS